MDAIIRLWRTDSSKYWGCFISLGMKLGDLHPLEQVRSLNSMRQKHSASIFPTDLVMKAGSSGREHRDEKRVLKEETTFCFPPDAGLTCARVQPFQALKTGRPKTVNCWSVLETQLTFNLCKTGLLLWFGNHNIETPENVFTQNLSHTRSVFTLCLKCLIWKLFSIWTLLNHLRDSEGDSGFPRPKSVSGPVFSLAVEELFFQTQNFKNVRSHSSQHSWRVLRNRYVSGTMWHTELNCIRFVTFLVFLETN